MSNPKWEIGPVKLANGDEAEIHRINESNGAWHYLGCRKSGDEWWPYCWTRDGKDSYVPGRESQFALAPPPKKTVRVRRWMVVYSNGTTCTFSEKDEAINEAKQSGFSLLEIDREVTEGEGL